MTAWLQRLAPQPASPVRLFCFHHAGGTAAAYRLWPRRLPEFEVCAVQLPGRANRLWEPPVGSIPMLVDRLIPELLPQLDRPYAMFGHSMGAVLAGATSHALADRGALLPTHLFVSGRRPAHMACTEPSLVALSDAEMLAEVDRRYGGFPPEVMNEPELLELLLPALRSDLEALESFRPPAPTPLPVPVTAYGGGDDLWTPLAHLEAWQADTSLPLRIRRFAGAHFYLDSQLDEIIQDVRRTLSFDAVPRS